jgi:hypothetical protein
MVYGLGKGFRRKSEKMAKEEKCRHHPFQASERKEF